jgi:hypothetical protein
MADADTTNEEKKGQDDAEGHALIAETPSEDVEERMRTGVHTVAASEGEDDDVQGNALKS